MNKTRIFSIILLLVIAIAWLMQPGRISQVDAEETTTVAEITTTVEGEEITTDPTTAVDITTIDTFLNKYLGWIYAALGITGTGLGGLIWVVSKAGSWTKKSVLSTRENTAAQTKKEKAETGRTAALIQLGAQLAPVVKAIPMIIYLGQGLDLLLQASHNEAIAAKGPDLHSAYVNALAALNAPDKEFQKLGEELIAQAVSKADQVIPTVTNETIVDSFLDKLKANLAAQAQAPTTPPKPEV